MLTIHSARLVDTRSHIGKSCKKLNFIGLSECSSPRCHHPSRREKATSSLWCLTLIIVSPWSERDKAFVRLAQVQGPEDLVLLPVLQTAPTFSACCLSYPARHNPDTFQQKMCKIRERSFRNAGSVQAYQLKQKQLFQNIWKLKVYLRDFSFMVFLL